MDKKSHSSVHIHDICDNTIYYLLIDHQHIHVHVVTYECEDIRNTKVIIIRSDMPNIIK